MTSRLFSTSLVTLAELSGARSVVIVTLEVSFVTKSFPALSPELASCQDGNTGDVAGTGGNCRLQQKKKKKKLKNLSQMLSEKYVSCSGITAHPHTEELLRRSIW